MFTAILEDGQRVTGAHRHWHEMPVGVRVASLAAQVSASVHGQLVVVADDVYQGFEAYGFQMYDIVTPDGVAGQGVQLLCCAGDSFLCVDIDLVTGQRRAHWRPRSAMTYNQNLLRPGVPAAS